MNKRELLSPSHLNLTLQRLARQIIETTSDFSTTVFLSLQPRGVVFGERLFSEIKKVLPAVELQTGVLDITFFRDDFRTKTLHANETHIPHVLENKKVVLIDDVLYTGRSIRAALDAMLSYGRPQSVELLVLIDRRFQRELPIQPTYVGKDVDSISSEYVEVEWDEQGSENRVVIASKED